jgi:hypothetical protein
MHKQHVLIALIALAALLVGGSPVMARFGGLRAQSNGYEHPQPLVGKTPDEVAQVALQLVKTLDGNVGDAPTVLLARSVTSADLPKLGLGEIGFGGEEPPLTLVALKGDFNARALMRRSFPGERTRYIVYVFDLNVGVPTLTMTSQTGGMFRTLLNDPTLPNEASVLQQQSENYPVSDDPALPMTPAKKLPYGAIAPAVPDPDASTPNP